MVARCLIVRRIFCLVACLDPSLFVVFACVGFVNDAPPLHKTFSVLPLSRYLKIQCIMMLCVDGELFIGAQRCHQDTISISSTHSQQHQKRDSNEHHAREKETTPLPHQKTYMTSFPCALVASIVRATHFGERKKSNKKEEQKTIQNRTKKFCKRKEALFPHLTF